MMVPRVDGGLICRVITWRTAACNAVHTVCGQEIHLCWWSHWDVWSCYCSISKLTLTNILVTKSVSSFSWVPSQTVFPRLPRLCGWVLANGLWAEVTRGTLGFRLVKRGTTFSPLFPFLLMTVTPRKWRSPMFKMIMDPWNTAWRTAAHHLETLVWDSEWE